VTGYLVATITWIEGPSQRDAAALLKEMSTAVEGGQSDGRWEGEGYRCTWALHRGRGWPQNLRP
jgi:hypothetical protein